MLHFDEVFTIDKSKMLINPKVTAKRNYAEDELKNWFQIINNTLWCRVTCRSDWESNWKWKEILRRHKGTGK